MRACVGLRARARIQTILLYSKYIVQWFLSISIYITCEDGFFSDDFCYSNYYGECGRDEWKRTVISQLWKSFVWLFSFFPPNCVYNNNCVMLYVCMLYSPQKYVACSHSVESERGRKNAIYYNRAGLKMLRLMEINGFVRYVLFCECISFSFNVSLYVSIIVDFIFRSVYLFFWFYIFGNVYLFSIRVMN